LRNFIEIKQVADLTRKETQTGGKEIQTLSSGAGVGLNLAGHVGLQGFSNNGKTNSIDTTSRLITANIIADLAQQFSKSVTVTYWREHGGSEEELKTLANKLSDFVLDQSTKVEASFVKGQDQTWSLTVGNTVLRSLSNEQMKQLVESSTNPKLNFTDKANVSYAGASAGDDKTFNGTDETKIKYTEDADHKWTPTGITLYALSTGTLKEGFDARIMEYFAKDGGLALDYVEPVLKIVVPGTDLSDVIKSEINNVKQAVNSTLSNLPNFQRARGVIVEGNGYGTKGINFITVALENLFLG
jgi:hypothetical protein